MDNVSRYEEMLHFYIINQEQKRIRTDLAWELLRQRKEKESGIIRIRDREDWKPTSVVLTEEISKRSDSVWGSAIQFPGEDRSSTHIQKSISFEQSLKPLLQSKLVVIPSDIGRLTDLVCEYWAAWKELAPEAFENPGDYVIQKTPGIFSLHCILPTVVEIASHVPHDRIDRKAFGEVIKPLEGDFGSDDWHKKNPDGAAQYGSMKGFAVLARKMEEELNSFWQETISKL